MQQEEKNLTCAITDLISIRESNKDLEMDQFPVEILYEVFRQLGPSDLLRCSLVCNTWHNEATQPRLWKSLDLSLLTPREVAALSSIADDPRHLWLSHRLEEYTTDLLLKCPSYIGPRHLKLFEPLIRRTHKLDTLHLDRIQLEGPTCDELFASLCASKCELTTLSLRQTLISSQSLRALLVTYGPKLRHLDLSYTGIDDSSLYDIAQYCPNLESLCIDAVFRLSADAIEMFFRYRAPLTLKNLSLKYTYVLRPNWLLAYAARQAQNTCCRLQRVYIEGCDVFTIKDVKTLSALTGDKCFISHSAILEEDSLQGYRSLIDRLATGIINDPEDSRIRA